MSDLKSVLDDLLADIAYTGVPAKITESYPAYWGYQLGVMVPIQNNDDHDLLAGAFFDYASTGGRVHYQDYSGEYRADQIADAVSPGGMGDYRKHVTGRIDIDFQISARVIFSKFSSSVLLRIDTTGVEQNLGFHATSVGIEAGIVPSYTFGALRAGISLSYMGAFAASLESNDFPNAFLINRQGKKMSIDWSGVKIGIVVGYTL
jgi:hypothetical protein